MPPRRDAPAVVVGDEEGNTFMGESYFEVDPTPPPKPSPKSRQAILLPKRTPKRGHALPQGALLLAHRNLSQTAALYADSLSRRTSMGEERANGDCEPWHASAGPFHVLYPGQVGGPATPFDPTAFRCPHVALWLWCTSTSFFLGRAERHNGHAGV